MTEPARLPSVYEVALQLFACLFDCPIQSLRHGERDLTFPKACDLAVENRRIEFDLYNASTCCHDTKCSSLTILRTAVIPATLRA